MNYYKRLISSFGYGAEYYNGYLINFFDKLFKNLELNKISPEDAKSDVKNLFKSDKSLNDLFLNSYNKEKKHLNIVGGRVRPFHRIRFGIINININKYEPIHYHDGFISFQIVLSGRCLLHEFDKVYISENKIQYKKHKEQMLQTGDVMLNYSKYRDIHGFGAISEPVSILSIGKYYGVIGKFRFKGLKLLKNNRDYVDLDMQIKKNDDELYEAPLINENLAYKKYSKINNRNFF